MCCDRYDPNIIFNNVTIVDFPNTLVGLKCTKYIHLNLNLCTSGYVKTTCEGQLIKFSEAREVSASHRAFKINQINSNKLEITFNPTNECISKARTDDKSQRRFVIPLHVIKIDERCQCNKELHSEILRFYICGQFEYNDISHYPKTVCFGEIATNKKVAGTVTIKNGSGVPVRIEYSKSTGFTSEPAGLIIDANSENIFNIIAQPPSLNFNRVIQFKIMNAHSKHENEIDDDDSNYLKYEILTEQTVKCPLIAKPRLVESLHKLIEKNKMHTYVGNEIIKKMKMKEIAKHYISFCKNKKQEKIEKVATNANKCRMSHPSYKPNANFCTKPTKSLSVYDVSQILFEPHIIKFGCICVGTCGEESITIKNNTDANVSVTLTDSEHIRYTQSMLSYVSLKIKPMCHKTISIFCSRQTEGHYEGIYVIVIQDKYCLKLRYSLYVGHPVLMLEKVAFDFGMLNKDTFVTTYPIEVYNYFNVDIEFNFEKSCDDLPFDIIPISGIIPKRKCYSCSIVLVTPTNLKRHEIDFLSSYGSTQKHVPLELNVTNGKCIVNFTKKELTFKDVPLNLQIRDKVELENISKEMVTFSLVDPLLPGFEVEPSSGVIHPKSIIIFEFSIKFSCVLKFSFDLCVNINSSEIKTLPITGNVTKPQVIIEPKILSIPRIPSCMSTYLPIVLHNSGVSTAVVESIDTSNKSMFGLYVSRGTIKEKITDFRIEPGATETIYIKVVAPFRHEYELFLPFKINGLLGPPNEDPESIEFKYYIDEYVGLYENNKNTKVIPIKDEISYCKLSGVITTTWIKLSRENFQLNCSRTQETTLDFTMVNVWKEPLPVTILTSYLKPYFHLELLTESLESSIDKKQVKFDLKPNEEAEFRLKLQPNNEEKVVCVAPLFLDKSKSIMYFNLTFVGTYWTCSLAANTYKIVFPPALVDSTLSHTISLSIDEVINKNEIIIHCKDDCVTINFLEEKIDRGLHQTIFIVEVNVCSKEQCTSNTIITFYHCEDTDCEVEVDYCFTSCPLTLHANTLIEPDDNPYPYFPNEENNDFFNYMTSTLIFLENWMYEEGFKKDLYPVFPDTFYVTASLLSEKNRGSKKKGIGVSYINFIRRVAGPLFMQMKEKSSIGVSGSYEAVKEIYEVYEYLIHLLVSRKSDLFAVQAKYLLSYEHFVLYSRNVPPTTKAEQIETNEFINNENLFNRRSKQSWLDFVIQTYKVFIVDACFFEYFCENARDRDIVKVLIGWYNENIKSQCKILLQKENQNDIKQINNLTFDLSDGIALISTILKYCPFLQEHFTNFNAVDNEHIEESVTNNACLIIEAMKKLKINFPLTAKNFLCPNFVQMLFLSIQLYIILPMYSIKDTLKFNPPLLQSSCRNVCVSAVEQENVDFKFVVLNDGENHFRVEKESSATETRKSCFVIEYEANFVEEVKTILIFYGSSKTRIFDTYVVFALVGYISSVPPIGTCKLSSSIYIPTSVNVLVTSPFRTPADFHLLITDKEPKVPVTFENMEKPLFYINRLTLQDTVLHLAGKSIDKTKTKLNLKMLCMSTQTGISWIWFRSDIGEFLIKVVTKPKWNLPMQTLCGTFNKWPIEPCDCGEECECFRTTVIKIPHKNDLVLTGLRSALSEFASDVMLKIYDNLIESPRGKVIIGMLLKENGFNMSELKHVFDEKAKYHLTSKTVLPRLETVTLFQHSTDELALPITLPNLDEKTEDEQTHTITLVSEDGLDVRTYALKFNTSKTVSSTTTTFTV